MSLLTILGTLIGLLTGIVVILIIDYLMLGRPLHLALQQKTNLQERLESQAEEIRTSQNEKYRTQAKMARLQETIQRLEETAVQQTNENNTLQHELSEAQGEIEVLHNNLNRVTDHLDKVQQEYQLACDKYESAAGENESLSEEIALLQEEVETLEVENQAAYQEIAANEAQLELFKQRLANHDVLAKKVVQLGAEKKALEDRLKVEESRLEDMKGTIDNLVKRVTISNHAEEKVAEAKARLATAQTKLSTLRNKMTQMESHLEYSGKNELQLIKGIGPTYAKRLNEIGVMTLADLSKQDPVRVATVVQLKPWQNHDPVEWIEEAARLSAPPE